ncbi:MAG: UDP-N-acetylmuramoyl-L-alanine--D-glutamate ligase [Candidatus Omnitrophica bacterium]|nr:UDP-N-acetylmuramoyl-L-alanine--D-glutamate ligase [Candidatus Omnitrophota bacterium]
MTLKLKGKKIAVVGLGRSGLAAAKFLAAQKAGVRVTEASDKKGALRNAALLKGLGVRVETGGHTGKFLLGSELVVTSPGVPKTSLPLVFAKKKKIPVMSEVDLASLFCEGPIVAVTGSNGKTTTSHLLHRFFVEAGQKSVLCGNVGFSFLDALASIGAKTRVVLETSSFQLEDSPHLKPRAAVVLNVMPNHLDRHGTFQNYVRAKEKIFANQKPGDVLILNFADPAVRRMAKRARSRVIFFSRHPIPAGFCVEDGWIVKKDARHARRFFQKEDFPLKGDHNLENILAAVAAADVFGVSPAQLQKTLRAFRALEHRIEPVGEIGGVRFVNDSKSTTVGSTRAAILATDGPIVLVAGGRDKGADFGSIEDVIEDKVKEAVLYGEAAGKIAGSWRSFRRFHIQKDFSAAARLAYRLAGPGDALLLSPMCASFDQFHSFEHRGETFKKIFAELAVS